MSSSDNLCCWILLIISVVCHGVSTHAQRQSAEATTEAQLSTQTTLPVQTANSFTTEPPSPMSTTSPQLPTEILNDEEIEFPYLIFAKRVAIHRTNLNGTEFETIIANQSFTTNAIAIDFDVRQDVMFWSDVEEKVIVRSRLDGSNATLLVDSGLSFPDGIAWDWVNGKLYWSDSEHREIEVYDPESSDRMQLVETGPDTIPRDVAVDPNTRWLYWTDWGDVAKIERVSMDGSKSSRQTLHSTELAWPNALTIDYTSQTLYWADAKLNKIERSNVDGSSRTLLTTNLILHPFGLTYHAGYLYWSDWQTDQITTTPIDDPDNVTVVIASLNTEPMGLEVVATSRQPISAGNPCVESNGNCSHLCLLSSTSPQGYSCGCPRGMRLADNNTGCMEGEPPTHFPEGGGSCLQAGYTGCCTSGDCLGSPAVCFCHLYCHRTGSCCDDILTTCPNPDTTTRSPSTLTLTTPFLLFANRQSINQMQLNGSKFSSIINTTINSVALDYNFRDEYVYWTDVFMKTINRARMDGTKSKVLISTNIGIPDGLACDWVSNKLYWTDASSKSISVYDLTHDHRMRLFSLGTNSTPRAIVVDPLTRWLYWSDWGRPAKIERASMDGTHKHAIVDTKLVWPNALTIDRSRQVLYWADASLDKIESANVDGTERTVLLQEGVLHPFSIAVFDSTLYWSDWQADTVFSSKLIAMRLTNLSSLVQQLSTEPMVVQVISTEIQVDMRNPCQENNGNCSHLCLLSVVERGFSCACPNGFVMAQGSSQLCVAIPPPTPTPTERSLPGSCRAAGYTSCCVDDLCEGEPPVCFCDIYCAEFEDCCDDFYDICPPDGGRNTTTILPPMPTPTPSLPVVHSRPSPTDNSVVTSSQVQLQSSRRRLSTKTRTRPSTHVQEPLSTPTPPETESGNRSELVSVGVVVGSLLASVFTIVLIALMVVLAITLMIIRQRTVFVRYQNFGETGSKEMTIISHRPKNQVAREAKA